MPRKGESIYKRKDGRWEARYIHHYENGKAKYKYIYDRSYSAVKAKKLHEITLLNSQFNQNKKEDIKFKELIIKWLDETKLHVKESTYTRYVRIVSKYLNCHMADTFLGEIDLHHLKLYINELMLTGGAKGKGLSNKTVSDILVVLKSIWKYGKECGYICPEIGALSCSSKRNRNISVLSKNDIQILERKIFNSEDNGKRDAVSLGILFALYTGLRIGELCGLRYEDIDLENGYMTINRTVERITNLDSNTVTKTKIIVSEPKTEYSKRTIPLPIFLLEYIRQLTFAPKWYVLTNNIQPTEPHQFYLRYKTYTKRIGLGHYTFHALRHTFATMCVEKGVDTKSLSELLGHSNIATTLSFYVHPSLEQKRKQIELLTPSIFIHGQNSGQ